MPKIIVKRKSTFIDMTAMSDVTVLLLTFFMLTSTFIQKEPVVVTTPASVSEIKIPETNILSILVDPEGKVFMSMDKRLAIFLTDESARTGSDTIVLTHEQIARYMGSAREVVSRMLKYFANEGIVEVSRKGIHILDKKRLRKLAL